MTAPTKGPPSSVPSTSSVNSQLAAPSVSPCSCTRYGNPTAARAVAGRTSREVHPEPEPGTGNPPGFAHPVQHEPRRHRLHRRDRDADRPVSHPDHGEPGIRRGQRAGQQERRAHPARSSSTVATRLPAAPRAQPARRELPCALYLSSWVNTTEVRIVS